MIFDSMQEELNSAIIETCDDHLKSLQLQIAAAKHIKDHAQSNRFRFSELKCLGDNLLRLPNETGVYLIFHEDRLAYVGYGNVANRVGKFKQDLTNEKATHRGAIKAKLVDASALNYHVSCVIIPDAGLAAKVEEYFMNDYSPMYCDQKMAGK